MITNDIEKYKLYNGDCLEVMKNIPNKTIDLVLIDPPYNIGKDTWDKWDTVEEYVQFMGKVFLEIQRVLKDNGSFYFFHNDFLQMVELQNYINKNTDFIFKSLLTINKNDNTYVKDLYGSLNHFRNYLNVNEYCLYYTLQHDTGLNNIYSNTDCFKELRKYAYNIREYINYSRERVFKILGHRRAQHFLEPYGPQWSLCTEETYNQLIDIFNIDKYEGFKTYEELRQEYNQLRQEYEKQRFTFNAGIGIENCLTYSFRTDKKYKHPTQKPLLLMEDLIKISSNEGDIVLDCFMGSGSTGVAALNTNRKFIGIEIEEKYFNIAKHRIENNKLNVQKVIIETDTTKKQKKLF